MPPLPPLPSATPPSTTTRRIPADENGTGTTGNGSGSAAAGEPSPSDRQAPANGVTKPSQGEPEAADIAPQLNGADGLPLRDPRDEVPLNGVEPSPTPASPSHSPQDGNESPESRPTGGSDEESSDRDVVV